MRAWLSIMVFVWIFTCGATAQETSPLIAETVRGDRLFEVELVDSPASRAKGLMFREHMPDNYGMLFDFHVDQTVSFWMKNTLIPLDLIFTDRNGVILQIHQNAIPHDRTGIPSVVPIRAVLEINAGLTQFLGIKVGGRLKHRIFGNL
jgi:uncharacterized membrane protein (UPF0127 family)